MGSRDKNTLKRGRKVRKVALISLAAVLLIIVMLAVFGVPAYISSESGRKTILAKINQSIDGRADFSDLSMGWFGGISVTDVSFNDNLGETSVKVKQISTKPHYGSLLTGILSFGKTVIEEPRVQVDLRRTSKEAVRKSAVDVPAKGGAGPVMLPVSAIDLVVNDGEVAVTDRNAQTVRLTGINSNVNLRPPGQPTSFDVSLAVANGTSESRIITSGTISPEQKAGWTLEEMDAEVTIDINDLDLASLAPFFELAGLDIQASGKVSANFEGMLAGGKINSLRGRVTASGLDITGGPLKGDHLKTASLTADAEVSRQKDVISIGKLDVKTDWLSARASGSVPTTFGTLADFTKAGLEYNLKADIQLDVAAAASQMPNTLAIKENMKVTGGKLNANVETSTEGGARVVKANATLADLAGVVDSKQVALSAPVTAVVEMTADEAMTRFEKLDVSSVFAKVSCTGTLEMLRYGIQADLAKMQSELGQFVDMGQYQTSGEILGNGTLSVSDEAIAFAGTSALRNITVVSPEKRTVSEPKADITYAGGYDKKTEVVSIKEVTVAADFGEVGIKDAKIPMQEGGNAPMEMVVSAKNVNLAKLQPFMVFAGALPEKMELSGVAESQVYVSGTQQQYNVTTDMTTIDNLKLLSPGKAPFEQKQVMVIFDGTFNPPAKSWNIKKLQLLSPNIKIRTKELRKESQADGSVQLEGNADVEYDWSAIGAMAAAYMPQGLELEGQRKDTITFSSTYPAADPNKMMANLDASAKLGFDKAKYQGLNIGKVDVDMKIKQGLLTIAPFSTTVNQGQLNFAAQADFTADPPLFETPGPMQIIKDVQITDEMTKELLRYVNPLFANAVNVSGLANFSCEKLAIPLAENAADKLDVAGMVSMTNVRLQASNLLSQILTLAGASTGENITVHPTQFVAKNGFLKYDNMQIDIGNNPVNFAGVIGITERDNSLNMKVTLPYTLAGRTVRTGDETGRQRITVPLGGTVDKPELDTSKLIEETIKGEIEDRLRDALEDLFK